MTTLFYLLFGCTKHIHHDDLLKVELGMSYLDVTYELGQPHAKASSKIEKYMDTNEPYLHEVFIYQSHADASSYIRNCYLVFTDKVLRELKCM